MPPLGRVKISRHNPRIVGVITNSAELRQASGMSAPPDLFELRLDSLVNEKALEQKARNLPAPLIITARHPAEGGKHKLPGKTRRDLLLRFLPLAQYVDIELRSVQAFRAVFDNARRIGASTIISFHHFGSTPGLGSLRAKAAQAARLKPAIFKVATRTDTPVQLGRLLEFISAAPSDLAISAMGIGKLGAISRLLFAQCGSVLIYTSVDEPRVEGQVSLAQFRVLLRQIDLMD
jgi:3-dehydroquinate dehydratase-1